MVAIHSFWDERKLLVFVALIIAAASITLLEMDAARNGRQSPIDVAAGSLFTPLEGFVTRTADWAGSGIFNLAHAGRFAAENRALVAKNQNLAAANQRLMDAQAENRELRRLLGMKQTLPGVSIVADVVGYLPEGTRRQVTIDRGTRDGVRRDSVVVGGAGLVGHVVSAGPHEAQVLLLVDPSSSVPAYLVRPRSWGIVTGTWLHAKIKYVDQSVTLQAGDLVVTGHGEVYPGGIAIGRVREIDRKDNALYQTAILEPAVDFQSLTHVLVLTSP